MRSNPLTLAIDGDRDGAISRAEMAAAPHALRALDKDGDGAVSMEELRPAGGGGANDVLDTLFSFDANKDGKLSKEEVPERMQGVFGRADGNKDGFLTRDEVSAAAPGGGQGPERRPERGGGPPPDPIFRALDTDGNRALSAAEIAGAAAALKSLDKNGDGVLNGEEIRPMMRGGGNPREMMERMFSENDTNKDGKLSKAEMPERMAEMFDRLDGDKDGFVTKEEMGRMGGGRRRE